MKLLPSSKILGGTSSEDRYNNGGEWLNSVFQTGPGKNLTGFVHAEYHYTDQGRNKVHKSVSLGVVSVNQISDLTFNNLNIAVCSPDFGKSWEARDQILTVGPNRTEAPWSGIGGFTLFVLVETQITHKYLLILLKTSTLSGTGRPAGGLC